ncbi:hypothetical protein BV25DRAFT_1839669 [Artomyces pyxidatus]|uniref:Uncharacterized protein n=1 Tax=Artomyces pyxidatus TaxID=48021 RepID=A0ACB8SV91_9AGAM|nr:hypothetical protein BV25DRAFT_1839669 [Artomyces pyxidatus]
MSVAMLPMPSSSTIPRTPSMNRPTGPRPFPNRAGFSGVSHYRADTFKPGISSQALDPRRIFRIHYERLSRYLPNRRSQEPVDFRSFPRERLVRLTVAQFKELSTDVCTELIRRDGVPDSQEIPKFLPVFDDRRPNHSQARQKLASLPVSRFKDLSSDILYEILRRYPEFENSRKGSLDQPCILPNSQ